MKAVQNFKFQHRSSDFKTLKQDTEFPLELLYWSFYEAVRPQDKNGRFYARDVKVVQTLLTSETLKSSVKCVVRTHLTEDVKCFCLIYRFYIIDVKAVLRRL